MAVVIRDPSHDTFRVDWEIRLHMGSPDLPYSLRRSGLTYERCFAWRRGRSRLIDLLFVHPTQKTTTFIDTITIRCERIRLWQ